MTQEEQMQAIRDVGAQVAFPLGRLHLKFAALGSIAMRRVPAEASAEDITRLADEARAELAERNGRTRAMMRFERSRS